MQVDGEACKLKPSILELSLLNQAVMLAKKKPGRANVLQATADTLSIIVHRIAMIDYEQHHYDKDLLKQASISIGTMDINPISDLEQVRAMINKHCEESPEYSKLSSDWCFVDCN